MSRLAPGERRACHACGKPIVGARSSSNPASVLPVVVDPVENGNVLIQQVDGVLTAFVVGNPVVRGALQDMGVQMRLNHYANCTDPERFRR
jgi:hypothetical protein